jgi:hypothetical protein
MERRTHAFYLAWQALCASAAGARAAPPAPGRLRRGLFLSLFNYQMTHYPHLSCWDRGQEISASVGREVWRQAHTMQSDLYRPGSERAKRASPKMTNEGLVPHLSCWERQGEGVHQSAKRGEAGLNGLDVRERHQGEPRGATGGAGRSRQEQT